MERKRALARRIASWITCSVFMAQTGLGVAAGPIMPDRSAPNHRQPLVLETANGIPLVQIAAPNAKGISHNLYTDFNVPKQGAILNNAYRMSQTKLAGQVQGNPNMVRGTARLIINEVTSNKLSHLAGYTEVAGKAANVIIANPNGIRVDGAGFINVPKATLVTGPPTYDAAGNLSTLTVSGGLVEIAGNGLDGRNQDELTILSRAIAVNAGIWANDLTLRTGSNVVEAATGTIQHTIAPEGKRPDVALDVASIGGMYANRIFLVGSERGLGVNMAGRMSSTKVTSIDVNGTIHVSGVMQAEDMQLRTPDDITVTGHTYSTQDTTLTGDTLHVSGLIAAGRNMTATMQHTITNTGAIGGGVTTDGVNRERGNVTLTGTAITHDKGTVAAGTDITMHAAAITATHSNLSAQGNVTMTTQAPTADPNQADTVEHGQQTLTDSTVSAKGNLTATADGAIQMTHTEAAADHAITITTQQEAAINRSVVTSGSDTTVTAGSSIHQADSHVYATRHLTETAGTDITNINGTVIAKGNTTLTAPQAVVNTGTIGAGIAKQGTLSEKGSLTVRGTTITNDASAMYAGEDMTLTGHTLTNTNGGQLIASRDVTADVTAAIANTKGTIASDHDVTIRTTDIQLDGRLSAGHDLTITTTNDITSRTSADGQGVTQAGHDLYLTTAGTLDSVKPIEAGHTVTIDADHVKQTGGAALNGTDVRVTAGNVTNEALITANDKVTLTVKDTVDNRDGGRIYGDAITIQADRVINHQNQADEDTVAREVAALRDKERALQAVFDRDITAFHSKADEERYIEDIHAATQAYDEQKTRTDAAIATMDTHDPGTIAARKALAIEAKTIENRAKGLFYSGDAMTLIGSEAIHNDGATIEAMGDLTASAPRIANTNETFSVKRVIYAQGNNPDQLQPGEGPEKGLVFPADEFDNNSSGYGTSHTKGRYKHTIDRAEYVEVLPLTSEEIEEGDVEPPDLADIGKWLPNYEYDDEIFANMGVTPMNRPRPTEPGPEQEQWDAENKIVFQKLNEKIDAYNKEAETYNASMGTVRTYQVHPYTYIRTHHYTSKNDVQETREATMRSGGDMTLTGAVVNENSRIVAGGTLTHTGGAVTNTETKKQIQTDTFGTTQFSYTYRRKRPHKSRRRAYQAEVFKTPERKIDTTSTLGIAIYDSNTKGTPAAQSITDRRRQDVTDFLDPFGVASPGTMGVAVGKPGDGPRDIRGLITSSLYTVNPSSTSDYLIETDSRFTDAKRFLGSDYMYNYLKWEPEHAHKRLGDGFYEQELIRNQILQHTGRRYLTGYHSDEEEFKALMDAGIAFAKEYHLTPGISLTKEQMAALTSDIVWLDTMTVMVNGRPMDVIYPRVYMRANSPMRLQDDGALISASQLVVNTKDTVENTGTLLGDAIVISADTLQQGGHIRAKTLGVTTNGDIVTTGTIDAVDTVQLLAGRDIRMNNTITHLQNQDVLTSMAGIAVSGDEGVLLLSANRDVTLAGATLSAMGDKSSIAIGAGRNVDLSTDTLMAKQDMTQDSNNYLRTYRKTELGTAIAGHDITILAKKDVTGRAATIEGTGDVRLGAGQSLTLTNGETISKDSFGAKYKVSGLLSRTTTTMKRDSEHRSVDGSLVTGRTVTMESGKDMHLTAATVVGDTAVTLRAGGNLTATAAEQYDHEASMISVKKSGLMGSGLGIMIGTQQTKDTAMGEGITQVGTVIGSGQGRATVEAGTHIHLTSSDVIGAKGIHIEGNSVTLDGKNNITRERYEHEASSSGLSISLGGSVANAATTAVNYLQQANHRSDKRLAALETLEAGKSLKEGLAEVRGYTSITEAGVQAAYTQAAGQAMQDMAKANLQAITAQTMGPGSTWEAAASMKAAGQGKAAMDLSAKANDADFITQETATNKAAKRDSLVNVHVGIGSSHSKSVTEINETTYAGGSVQSADGTVRIIARGDSNTTSNADTIVNGNITAIGQTIQGKVVDLQAKGDVNLLAGTNTTHVTEDSKSSGWSVGASIGTTGFLGGDIGINKAKSEGLTDRTTHTGTTVVGTEAVSITSGQDTNVVGSTVSGNKVVAKVGNDLTITSLQDTDNYKSTSKTSGMSISYTPGHAGIVSGGTTKGDIHSQYRSVTSQAGIYAGNDGYDITVKDNTTVTGSVIDSEAASNVNRLTTGSLTMKDINNEASYAASSGGFNISTAKGTGLNPLGLGKVTTIPVSGDGSSTTRSAIADGIISVADTQSVSDINHNTKEALQTLGQIFDKKKVEEKQELVNLMAKDGYTLIGDISVRKAQEYITKAERAEQQGHPQQAERYREEAKKWSEGGTYKLALHGSFGAVLGAMSGNSGLGGATAATTNEAVQAILGKVQDGEVHKLLSEVVGTVVSGRTGGAIANAATEFNWLTHEEQQQMMSELSSAKDAYTIHRLIANYAALSNYRSQRGLGTEEERSETIDESFENFIRSWVPEGHPFSYGMNYLLNEMVLFNPETYNMAQTFRTEYERGELNAAPNAYVAYWVSPETAESNMPTYLERRGYDLEGDYYAYELHGSVITIGGQNYVYYGRKYYPTTAPAQYTENQIGDMKADNNEPVYASDSMNYVIGDDGKHYYANREATVLPISEVKKRNFENVVIDKALEVYDKKVSNVSSDYTSFDAAASVPVLGKVNADISTSVGVDRMRNVYLSYGIGASAGVGIGSSPVSVGASHQNFVESTSGWTSKDYSERIEGESFYLNGNIMGVQQGYGFDKNINVSTKNTGIDTSGEIFGGRIGYNSTWKIEYNPPVSIDRENEDDEWEE